jgi:peptidoglycan/LPS O-acetylase OafA/YrhL
MATAARDGHIDTLRGIACLLLVAYHVIGNDPSHGMHITAHDNWRLFADLFVHVRMPLFSFLSGYLFSAFVADAPALGASIARKLRRLAIPLFAVSTLFYLCFGAINGSFPLPIWQIYVLPYEHFWFLQATILIMTGLLLLCCVAGARARTALTALFPVACLVFIAAPVFHPDIFSVSSALYLLPFFLLGQLLRVWRVDRPLQTFTGRPTRAALLFGACVVVLSALDIAQYEGLNTLDFSRQSPLGLLFGLSTCLFLFFSEVEWAPLAWIGSYSYSIYLFHVFFTAGLRKALAVGYPAPAGLYFSLALVAGTLLPIALHKILLRGRWSALLLLGINRRPEVAARDAYPSARGATSP